MAHYRDKKCAWWSHCSHCMHRHDCHQVATHSLFKFGCKNCVPSGGGDPAAPTGGGEAPTRGGGTPIGRMDGAGPNTASGSGGGAPTTPPV